MSREQKGNKEGKKKPAMTPKEKKQFINRQIEMIESAHGQQPILSKGNLKC